MSADLVKMANGLYAMAYVGEVPWHRDGQELTLGATIEEWSVQSGLNWRALMAPVGFQRADGGFGSFEDKAVIYRSDTGEPLSVMGRGYKPVHPIDCLEFFRDMVTDQGWHLHTAGLLRNGRKIWAMASPRQDATQCVVKHDAVRPHLLLTTSLDGTAPTQAGLTATRVVCANTLGIALNHGLTRVDGTAAPKTRVSHRSHFDAAAVKAEIGVSLGAFGAFMKDAHELAEKPIELEQAREILRELFGQPVAAKRGIVVDVQGRMIESAAPAADVAGAGDFASLLARPAKIDAYDARADIARMLAKGDAREQKSVARCLALFAGEGMGADADGVKGTAWGLLNAVTQHVDHEQGRTDTRLESAWFGRGADFKNAAFDALVAI